MKKILTIICILTISNIAKSQPGSLDNTFGTAGKVITDFGSLTSAEGYTVVVQSDGKIVMAGTTTTGSSGTLNDFIIVRHNADGTFDNSFGTNGIVTTDFVNINNTSLSNQGKTMAIQSDGKIVVAGTVINPSANYPYSHSFGLARYNTNGTLDNTFGTNGMVHNNTQGYCQALALQSDGKILVTGYPFGGNYMFTINRWNADGSVDLDFGTGLNMGTENYQIGGQNYSSIPHSIIAQNNGKILVTGYYYPTSSTSGINRFALIRLNNDGSYDNSFSTDPNLLIGSYLDNAYCAAIQSDGKILVAGMTSSSVSVSDWVIVRLNMNGTMENSFGVNGIAIVSFLSSGNEDPRSIAIQNDGKIVVAGSTGNNAARDIALVRLNSNGSPDNTFGSYGKVITPVGSGEENGYSVALQSDGKILAAGYTVSNNKRDFVLMRYKGSGSVGVMETEATVNVHIYPNPSNDFLIIEGGFEAEINITLTDVSGKQVLKQTENGLAKKYELNTERLSNGIYMLKIQGTTQQVIRKVNIMH